MAENSLIEWLATFDGAGNVLSRGHTANFWWGCEKVSAGCKHCYADTWSSRFGESLWGPPKTTGRRLIKSVWDNLRKWDREAGEAGRKDKVFVMSMGDFLEDHPDVAQVRIRACELMEECANLIFMILTKRPENRHLLPYRWGVEWPQTVWMGTSVENQAAAEKRIPELILYNAPVLFASCEPLLGQVDLTAIRHDGGYLDALSGQWNSEHGSPDDVRDCSAISWVFPGGESGPNARPMDMEWARSLRDQCVANGVAYFFKQVGGVNKKKTGRLLDGRYWNEMPEVV